MIDTAVGAFRLHTDCSACNREGEGKAGRANALDVAALTKRRVINGLNNGS